jgi:hypothetical protein
MSGTEQNPLKAAYWVGDLSPEPLAAFRIALGLSLLHDLLNFAPNVRAFLSDDGILPRATVSDASTWNVFEWVHSTAWVQAVFVLGACSVLAFTMGYRTRLATVLSFAFVVSIRSRNSYIDDGGDDLVRNLLFLSIFADLGGCYSFDALLGRRRRGNVSILGLRFLQLHIALLYFCAGRLKLRAGWLTHNVIYRALQLAGFVRPPGALLAQFPSLCYGLGVATLALELAFAALAFSPILVGLCRAMAILASLGVQLGILATMRVGVFTEVMIATNLLFVPPEWIRALESRIRRLLRREAAPSPDLSLGSGANTWGALSHRPMLAAGLLFLSFNFLTLAWGPFVGRRFPQPPAIGALRRALLLDQPFGLFDHVYPGPRWAALGTLPGGQRVDVLAVAVPELIPRVAWSFSRWYKFTFVVQDHPFPYQGLANYLCTEYEHRAGRALDAITLSQTLTLPTYAGEAPAPAESHVLVEQPCPKAH